jgi:hypothetical protein
VGGLLVALGVLRAITGPHLVNRNDAYLKLCKADGTCATSQDPVQNVDAQLQNILNAIALILPALIGIFWGAPLIARELETGTHRLAWTQSITRLRWVMVKLGVVGLMSIATAGLYSLMVTWWSSPIDFANQNRFATGLFAERGIVPMGYAAFGFALGVLLGVLIRRSVPAMAATLVTFSVSRYALQDNIRPRLMSPLRLVLSKGSTQIVGIEGSPSGTTTVQAAQPGLPNAWVYSSNLQNAAGQGPSQAFLNKACPVPQPQSIGGGPISVSRKHAAPGPSGQNIMQTCSHNVTAKFHAVITYQPISRYWDFQLLETASYVVLAVILAGAAVGWVRRRLT